MARALADQAIDRGDRVLLLCNKGEVTAAFNDRESVLIAAHHRDSYALDFAADIRNPAAARQFSHDLIPPSTPPFWSNTARTALTDIIIETYESTEGKWDARTLLTTVLQDPEAIRRKIAKIDLSAGPLLQSSDPDGMDKTVQGIWLTIVSGVFANLRDLAWAWSDTPEDRRFSVERWLSDDYTGPRTVIVQYSPEYKTLSSLVASSLICRIARRVGDPAMPIDEHRRVWLILD